MGDEGSEQSGAWHKKKTLQEIMGSHNFRNTNIMGSGISISFLNIPKLSAAFVLLGRSLPAIYCTTYYIID
jgi:hypothetical protein